MAFILTPRLAPAYQAPQCSPFSCYTPVTRPVHSYRVSRPQPRRPQYSPFEQFVSQLDELLLSEFDREAQHQAKLDAHLELQREAHRQRQLRKRTLRARFSVNQIEQGWQVVGDIQGFEQENISIELADEHTLKISGNTQWLAENSNSEEQNLAVPEQSTPDNQNDDAADTVTEAETSTLRSASPDSDNESHKSYQATVEDDFEDLGAEAASTISAMSERSSPAEPTELKGKDKATEKSEATETPVARESEQSIQKKQQEASHEQDRTHGTFEKVFRFPERIDVANVGASFRDGALRIIVPKAQPLQTRRIAIL